MNIFKRKKKFMECSTLDDFKKMYVLLVKQDLALEDNRTYFEFQDNTFGEYVDNSVRLKFLKDNNKKYCKQCDLDVLSNKAEEEYKADKKEYEESLDIDKASSGMKVKDLKKMLSNIDDEADVKILIDNDRFDIEAYYSEYDNTLDICKGSLGAQTEC